MGKSLAKRMTRKSQVDQKDLTQSCPSLNEIEPKSVASLLRMDATPQTRNGRRAITNWFGQRCGSTRAELADGPSPFRQTQACARARRRATSTATENSSSSLEMNPFLRVWSRVGGGAWNGPDVSQRALLMQNVATRSALVL